MAELTNKNTHNLRNRAEFKEAIAIFKKDIFKTGLKLLLDFKHQFQIYQKEAAVFENRGNFQKALDSRGMTGQSIFILVYSDYF